MFFVNFMIGACLASHAGVICDRYLKEDFLLTRSKCNFCKTELPLLAQIPLVSYIVLKGKCSYCGSPIPPLYFFIELIGGLAFLKLDLLNLSNIYLAIFLFYLLVIVCFDYQKQEFPSIFLIPLFSAAFIYWLQTSPAYSLIDALEFFPICLILLIYTFFHKLGSGDLIIYIILALMWNPHFANLAFLVGAIFSLVHYFLEYKYRSRTQPFAFIPYIYLGLVSGLLSF